MNNSQDFNRFLVSHLSSFVQDSIRAGIYSKLQDWDKVFDGKCIEDGVREFLNRYNLSGDNSYLKIFNMLNKEDAKQLSTLTFIEIYKEAFNCGVNAVPEEAQLNCLNTYLVNSDESGAVYNV